MYPRSFEYVAPTSLDEALAALNDNPGAKVMTGGMSLIPLMKLRLFSPPMVVDLGKIEGLDGISENNGHISIGALVRHAEVDLWDGLVAGDTVVLDLDAMVPAPRTVSGDRRKRHGQRRRNVTVDDRRRRSRLPIDG